MKTVVGLFERYEDAENAIQGLTSRKFSRSMITVVARDPIMRQNLETRIGNSAGPAIRGFGLGAALGIGVGAILALLMLLRIIAVAVPFPGVNDPILALIMIGIGAGVGAVAGAIIGLFVRMGAGQENKTLFVEGIRRGTVLVAVQTKDNRAAEALSVMRQSLPSSFTREPTPEEWRRSDWRSMDEANPTPRLTE